MDDFFFGMMKHLKSNKEHDLCHNSNKEHNDNVKLEDCPFLFPVLLLVR